MKKLLVFLAALLTAGTLSAQITKPMPGAKYQIMNSVGMAMAYMESHLVICTPNGDDVNQQWMFEVADDGYYLFNVGTEQYAMLGDSNGWDAVFSYSIGDVSKATFSIEVLANGNLGLRLASNGKYAGTDATTSGSWVYLDKSTSNNGYWYLVSLGNDAQTEYEFYKGEVEEYAEAHFPNYGPILDAVSDSLSAYDDIAYGDGDYEAASTAVQGMMNLLQKASQDEKQMLLVMETIEALLDNTEYPGVGDLEDAYAEMLSYIDDGMTFEILASAASTLNDAIRAYYLSQLPEATDDNPADLTPFISCPSFRLERDYSSDATPAGDGWEYQHQYRGTHGGDYGYRHKYADETGRDITCYNAWSDGFDYLDIHQDIEGLPEGRYVARCIAWTEPGMELDQHLYITSHADGTVRSAGPTTQMESDEWETFTTTEAAVFDGYLRIGFTSVNDEAESSAKGWFLVTDFQLFYLGPVQSDELKEGLNALLAAADTVSTPLKGDQEVLAAAIAQGRAAESSDDIKAALLVLNAAIERAQASAAAYDKFVAEQMTVEDITDADAAAAMNAIINHAASVLAADTTTAAVLDLLKTGIKAYRSYINTYLDVALPCLAASDGYSATAIATLQEVIASQWSALKNICSADEADALTDNLSTAVKNVKITATPGPDCDMTFLMHNPDATDGGDNWLSWWEVTLGNGNKYTNLGQSFNGDTSDRYIDSWNGTAGVLAFTAKQWIGGLPNGTYTLKAACRADGEGAYLLAQANGTTYTSPIPVDADVEGSIYLEAYNAALAEAMEKYQMDEITVQAEGLVECPVASFGWNWVTVEGIQVTDHTLTVGVSTDANVTGGTSFVGTWLSGDKFQIFYVAEGDNSDFPYDVHVDTPLLLQETVIYDLMGRRVTTPTHGIYLIGGKKVLVP